MCFFLEINELLEHAESMLNDVQMIESSYKPMSYDSPTAQVLISLVFACT